MPPSGQTVSAVATGDVSFGNDEIAASKTFNVVAHAIHNADKLMANDHRHGNRVLRPCVPVIDVHVRATDGCLQDADEHIIAADFWNRNILEPETWFRSGFDNRLHGLHDTTLGQSEKHEKVFATSIGSMENHLPRVIAEDVAKVNPNLVAHQDGKIYTVRYEAVNAMLLNEFLKEHRKVEEQQATIRELKKELQAGSLIFLCRRAPRRWQALRCARR
jgi:hypothetical protein